MKRWIALFVLAACTAHAGVETVTVNLENQSDHAITALHIWEVNPDGSVVDDALANFDAAIAPHTTGQVSTDMIRCFDRVLVDVTYDDGKTIAQEADLCKSADVKISY